MKIFASSATGKGEDEKDKNTSWQTQQQQFSNHECNDEISGSDNNNFSCPCKLVNGSNQPSINPFPINNLTINTKNHKTRNEKWSSIDLKSPRQANNRDTESLSTISDDLYYKYIRLSLLLITFLAATGIILITLGYFFFNYYNINDDHHQSNFVNLPKNEMEHVYRTDTFDTPANYYHDYATQEYID